MTTKKILANPLLMSIAAAVSYISGQLKCFNRVARVGGGFIENSNYSLDDVMH